jgi:PAS domain-containing protein
VTAVERPGGKLVLPLRQLDPPPTPFPDTRAARHLVRDLEVVPTGALAHWATTARVADEPCLVLDADGRVAALSAGAAELLSVTATAAAGALLVDLVTALDFTASAAPEADLERSLPPLRALGGVLARGLVRLRQPDGRLVTYDVVSAPLDGGVGSLSFLIRV